MCDLIVCEMFLTEFIQWSVLTNIFSWHTLSLKLDHKHCVHNTAVNGALDFDGAQLVFVECSLSPDLLSSRYLFSLISHFILVSAKVSPSQKGLKTMLSKIVLPTSSPFIHLPCFILLHSAYQLPGIWVVWVFPAF